LVSSGNRWDLVGNGYTVCVSEKGALRWIVRDKVIYIPFDPWSLRTKGLGAGNVEVPIRRSGADSVGRGATGSASRRPSMRSISLLFLLRFRRWLFGRQMKLENFILSLGQSTDGGAITEMARLVAFIPF